MIFENSIYKNKESNIVFKYIRYKKKYSRLKIAKLLGIPYNTYSRIEENGFKKRLDVLIKIEEIFNIRKYNRYDELNNLSDKFLFNYLYNRKVENIDLSMNDISFIQYYINCLIISDLRDKDAINELSIVKDELIGLHKILYDQAVKNINNELINNVNENKYVHAYLSYVKLKSYYLKEKYVDFIIERDKIFKILEEYLMIDRLLELRMYDIIVLYKLNSSPIDNINYLIGNNKYIEELRIIKSLYYLKNNNIGQALGTLKDSFVLDKYLIICHIEKKNYNEIKKDGLKKSKIYFLVENEVKKL